MYSVHTISQALVEVLYTVQCTYHQPGTSVSHVQCTYHQLGTSGSHVQCTYHQPGTSGSPVNITFQPDTPLTQCDFSCHCPELFYIATNIELNLLCLLIAMYIFRIFM